MSLGLELITYKDCLLLAAPSKNEGGRWTLNVQLSWTTGTGLEKHEWKSYTGEETFDSEEEAISHSLILGREIVDREGAG